MTQTLKFRIHRFKQTDSTNSLALRWGERGAPAGSVFVTDFQTRGRGKWGRKWVSPNGENLLFSILLRPRFKAARAPGLTQLACRSVAKVLTKRFCLPVAFKRPNDLLVRGKKICGILVEARGRATGELENLVIGIGLNVNSSSEELVAGATSLREETGKRQSLPSLLKAILRELGKDLDVYVAYMLQASY